MILNDYNKSRDCADKKSLCHAPNYSLHFSKNGLVSACSYTRFMPLGKYPDQTIEEIWFGSTAHNIRKEMRTDAFPKGCQVCSSNAEAGNYGQMRSKLYDQYAVDPLKSFSTKTKNKFKTGKFAEYPKVMSFELSNTCNLECVMCLGLLSSSIRKNREKLPPLPQMYDAAFTKQLTPFIPHLKEVKFFGGEPFLIDLYLDIWELFVQLNPLCKIYITTNGTILNNRVKNILEKLPNFQMIISLDAIYKETYEKIRVNASYEKVMENLQYFKAVSEKFNRRLIISPTYMSHNCNEYPEILDFANTQNIYFETNLLETPPQLAVGNFPPDELAQLLTKWKNHQPKPAPNQEVYDLNLKEFNKALRQVEFMLKEQEIFYAHPLGKKIAAFRPQNKMENCIATIVTNSLKTTIDPATALRLLELWKSPENIHGQVFKAMENIVVSVYEVKNPTALREMIDRLMDELNKNYDQETLLILIQRLLNNQEKTIQLIHILAEGNENKAWELLEKTGQSSNDYVPVDADFF
jgi:MoaA/NifB/PqqE/SkfB family radical SAM enzyme